MGLRSPPAARLALGRYLRGHHTSAGTRAHVALRWLSCPFPALEAAVPSVGSVLEIGCGHGLFSLYLALASPSREVSGVDIDAEKLAEGRRAAAGVRNLSLEDVPADWRPLGEWPTVVIIDVLYLLGPGPGDDLLAAAAAAVAPGGRLIVKEIDTVPTWKYRLAIGQELAATRLAHVTHGATVRFLSPDRIEAAMVTAGLVVSRRRLDRGYPHPHLLLIGERRRPGGGEPEAVPPTGAGGPQELQLADHDRPKGVRVPDLTTVGAYAPSPWP